jgi:prophage tail gpP-like protein
VTVDLECPLTIEWEALPKDRQPRVITAYSLDSAYLTSTDEWSVTVYDTDPERLRWLALQPLSLSIHGNVQLFGRVERVRRGDDGGAVTISGRDHLSAIVEGNIDPTVRITEDMTLAAAILTVGLPHGIMTVYGDADAQTRSMKAGVPLKDGKDQGFPKIQPGNLKPEAGAGSFEWLNKLAARQGCTIQPGPQRGSVILSAPCYDQDPTATFKRSRSVGTVAQNNVIDATSDENYSSFPTCGLATGKVAATGKKAEAAAKVYDIGKAIAEVAPQLYAKIRDLIISERSKPVPNKPAPDPLKLYRFLYVKDEESRTAAQVEKAITRAVSERLRETLNYTVKAKGHRDPDSGAVFAIDTLATVKDEIADVDEVLWCASRRFTFQRNAGATSDLTYWRPGSFVL